MRQDTLLVRTAPKKALAGLALGLALSFGQTAQAEVAYSYTDSNYAIQIFGNNFRSLGDDVTLAPGTGRNVTSIAIETNYYFDENHLGYTPDLTLTLYDSTTTLGTDGSASVIGSATATGALFTGGTAGTFSFQTITFLFVGGVLVPDSFFLAVSQNDVSPLAPNDSFGLSYGDSLTAAIGTTAPTIFQCYPNAPGSICEAPDYGVPGLVVDINAVPEPATLALLGLGLVPLGFRRRKRA